MTEPITELSQLPVVLTLDEFCAVLRRKFWQVRKELSRGTCVPAPAFVRPYRWLKTDIQRHLEAHGLTVARKRA
jgi:hypothetical protein